MKRTIPILLLAAASVCVLYGCKGKGDDKLDVSSIHTTAAESLRETMAPQTTAKETTAAETEPASSEESESGQTASVSYEVLTWHPQGQDGVSVQYPRISGLGDDSREEQINTLLEENALALFHSMEEAPASMEINCRVDSLDRSRLTAVYDGSYTGKDAAHPVQVFYTNTVDLDEVRSLGFNDYSDAYTMAGYVMSEDVEFFGADPLLTEELLKYRADQSLEYFTALFNQADFPLDPDSDAAFPESFSYTGGSMLYFSIPVPHALGDYALIQFPLDGK